MRRPFRAGQHGGASGGGRVQEVTPYTLIASSHPNSKPRSLDPQPSAPNPLGEEVVSNGRGETDGDSREGEGVDDEEDGVDVDGKVASGGASQISTSVSTNSYCARPNVF